MLSNDPAACAALYADDAVLILPGAAAIKGKKAILDAYSGWLKDMKVTEANVRLTFAPWSGLALQAGYNLRAESTPTAVVQWRFAEIGARTRLDFVGGRFSPFAGLSLLPMGKLQTDTAQAKEAEITSLAGEAGLEVQTGFFHAALGYYVERFTFPVLGGSQRIDEFSMLRLRIGFQAGR